MARPEVAVILGRVAFDIFLQGFQGGDAADVEADVIRRLVDPLVIQTRAGFVRIQTGDGEADIYGYDNPASGLVVNHASGDEVWDLLVELARSAELVVMPVGTSVCVASETMIDELPAELRHDVTVVRTGADLLKVVTS